MWRRIVYSRWFQSALFHLKREFTSFLMALGFRFAQKIFQNGYRTTLYPRRYIRTSTKVYGVLLLVVGFILLYAFVHLLLLLSPIIMLLVLWFVIKSNLKSRRNPWVQ